jgi:hypothetical protein
MGGGLAENMPAVVKMSLILLFEFIPFLFFFSGERFQVSGVRLKGKGSGNEELYG